MMLEDGMQPEHRHLIRIEFLINPLSLRNTGLYATWAENLESMETLFLDTLERSASATQDLIRETLSDLATHARRNGTAVGSQLKDTLTAFSQQMTAVGQTQLEAGVELTHAITNLMREAASDALAGIAERVKPEGGRGSK